MFSCRWLLYGCWLVIWSDRREANNLDCLFGLRYWRHIILFHCDCFSLAPIIDHQSTTPSANLTLQLIAFSTFSKYCHIFLPFLPCCYSWPTAEEIPLLCIVHIWDGQFDIDFHHSRGRQQAFVAKLIHHLYCHSDYFGFPLITWTVLLSRPWQIATRFWVSKARGMRLYQRKHRSMPRAWKLLLLPQWLMICAPL